MSTPARAPAPARPTSSGTRWRLASVRTRHEQTRERGDSAAPPPSKMRKTRRKKPSFPQFSTPLAVLAGKQTKLHTRSPLPAKVPTCEVKWAEQVSTFIPFQRLQPSPQSGSIKPFDPKSKNSPQDRSPQNPSPQNHVAQNHVPHNHVPAPPSPGAAQALSLCAPPTDEHGRGWCSKPTWLGAATPQR